jgi:hypothetical protein
MIGLLNTALTEARRLANQLCLHIAQQQVNLGKRHNENYDKHWNQGVGT